MLIRLFLEYLELFFFLYVFQSSVDKGIKGLASYIFSGACNFYRCKTLLSLVHWISPGFCFT